MRKSTTRHSTAISTESMSACSAEAMKLTPKYHCANRYKSKPPTDITMFTNDNALAKNDTKRSPRL